MENINNLELTFKISAYPLQSKSSTVFEKSWKQSIPKPTPIKEAF